MVSPLGPTLANFFLAHLENQFMGQQDVFMPVHIYIYIYIYSIYIVYIYLDM